MGNIEFLTAGYQCSSLFFNDLSSVTVVVTWIQSVHVWNAPKNLGLTSVVFSLVRRVKMQRNGVTEFQQLWGSCINLLNRLSEDPKVTHPVFHPFGPFCIIASRVAICSVFGFFFRNSNWPFFCQAYGFLLLLNCKMQLVSLCEIKLNCCGFDAQIRVSCPTPRVVIV